MTTLVFLHNFIAKKFNQLCHLDVENLSTWSAFSNFANIHSMKVTETSRIFSRAFQIKESAISNIIILLKIGKVTMLALV